MCFSNLELFSAMSDDSVPVPQPLETAAAPTRQDCPLVELYITTLNTTTTIPQVPTRVPDDVASDAEKVNRAITLPGTVSKGPGPVVGPVVGSAADAARNACSHGALASRTRSRDYRTARTHCCCSRCP